MTARRYYLAIIPVSHINGKMAPVAEKCPNTEDPEHQENRGFWYGYRHKNTPNISRYGIRTLSRDLTTKPYTTAETENRDLFTASLIAVNTNLQDTMRRTLCERDFLQQRDYATLRGYAIATCRANNGEWPQMWIP